MKNLMLILLLVLIKLSFSQSFTSKEKWSFMQTKYINVSVLPQFTFGGGVGGPIPPQQGGTVYIDWGDGSPIQNTSFIHNTCSMDMSFGYSILPFQHSFNHVYVNPGSYNVSINVNDLAGNPILTNQGNNNCFLSITSPNPNPNNIGFVGIKTLSCNWISVDSLFPFGVPYDFTDNLGTTTTIYPVQNQVLDSTVSPICWNYQNPNIYQIYPMPMVNLPYTIQINQNWLNSNGYSSPMPSNFIPSFPPGGLPIWEIRGGDGIWLSDPEFCISCPPSINQPINGFFGFYKVGLTANVNNPNIPDFGFGFCNSTANAITQSGNLELVICNGSCGNMDNVNVQIQFPPNIIPNIGSLVNPTFIGSLLTFDVLNLSGTGCTNITIPFSLPGSTVAGTTLSFTINLSNPIELNSSNNSQVLSCIVSNSQDPNFKEVNQPLFLDHQTTEELIYTIHFENEGNASAANIYVTDLLSDNLNLSSFKFLNTSHACSYTIDTISRLLTVQFNSINLLSNQVDSVLSKGNFSYSLEEINNIELNDTIKNNAAIFFDFNAPLITNYTYNVNYSALNLDKLTLNHILNFVYPNPVLENGLFSIFCNSDIEKVELLNSNGKVLLNYISNGTSFNINEFSAGTYILKVNSNNEILHIPFVKL
jgi:uncharacterized repeat protein (TIGR01451 family)